ncbi:MAG: TIGR04211 family SH3 domain-containing protein, partial [bacterium]
MNKLFFTSVGIALIMIFFLIKGASASTMYVIETNVINVRSGPNTDQKVIAKIKSGDAVTILSEEKGWYQIRTTKDEKGWVIGSCLKDEKPLIEQITTLTDKINEQTESIKRVNDENESLKKYVASVESNQAELKKIKEENFKLKDYQEQMWFGIGGGILFIGWIIGIITGSWRRKGKARYRY